MWSGLLKSRKELVEDEFLYFREKWFKEIFEMSLETQEKLGNLTSEQID